VRVQFRTEFARESGVNDDHSKIDAQQRQSDLVAGEVICEQGLMRER
jgi:hypothetical protein